jgi:hypothetical protein
VSGAPFDPQANFAFFSGSGFCPASLIVQLPTHLFGASKLDKPPKNVLNDLSFLFVDQKLFVFTVDIVAQDGNATAVLARRLAAETLSRIRSAMASRSHWAKVMRTLSIIRPVEAVELICWVTATKLTLAAPPQASCRNICPLRFR